MSEKSKGQVFLSRLISTLVLWAAVTGVFISANPWAFVALIFILGAAAVNEFFTMAKKGLFPSDRIWGTGVSIAYLAVACILLAAQGSCAFSLLHELDSVVIAGLVLFSFIYQLKSAVVEDIPFKKVASTLVGFLYVAFLFSFMARLLFLDPTGMITSAVPGAWLVLWVCIVTKFTDMGAYLTGTICGTFMKTHKMIPHISPGKTWEGFVGAMVIALASACGLYALLPEKLPMLYSWTHVITLGLILPLFAVVGDLAESVIKRSLKVKDSGSFLPGIGGALDLIDSLCFTAPVVYFYLRWVSHF